MSRDFLPPWGLKSVQASKYAGHDKISKLPIALSARELLHHNERHVSHTDFNRRDNGSRCRPRSVHFHRFQNSQSLFRDLCSLLGQVEPRRAEIMPLQISLKKKSKPHYTFLSTRETRDS